MWDHEIEVGNAKLKVGDTCVEVSFRDSAVFGQAERVTDEEWQCSVTDGVDCFAEFMAKGKLDALQYTLSNAMIHYNYNKA